MPKFIPTGWFPTTGRLFNLPKHVVASHSGILFYSEYNRPEEIDRLKDFSKNLKNALVIRLEDIPEAGENNIGPTLEKMQIIKSFIDSHHSDDFIIACHAGISRADATVDYLMQIYHFTLDLDLLSYENVCYSPNKLMTMYLEQLNPNYHPSNTLDYYPQENIWRINDDEAFKKVYQ